MTNLTVRGVEEELARALKIRASANGRSAEAEHRVILRNALMPTHAKVDDFAAAAGRLRTRLSHDGDVADIIRSARDSRSAPSGSNA